MARLDKDWTGAEEEALRDHNPYYTEVLREIEALQSHWDADALTTPQQRVHRDPKYRDASKTMAERVTALQKRVRHE